MPSRSRVPGAASRSAASSGSERGADGHSSGFLDPRAGGRSGYFDQPYRSPGGRVRRRSAGRPPVRVLTGVDERRAAAPRRASPTRTQRRCPRPSGVDDRARSRARSRAAPPRRAGAPTWAPGAPRRRGRPRRSRPVAAAGASVDARAGDRERDREVGAGLGDAHAAGDARVDVVAGERRRRARCCEHGERAARAGRRRTPARRGAASAPASATTSACTSTSSGRAPSSTAATTEPGAPARRSARNSALGSGTPDEPVAGHLEEPELVGRTEAVLRARAACRSAWCRSPSNESTVSTTCSSVRGPASEPSLVTWPTSSVAMPCSLASRTQPRARRRAPGATEPGPPGDVGIVHGLDRVDREHVGPASPRRARARRGSDVSATTSRSGGERPEPVGPQAHLRGRLLGAHEQAAGAGGRHARRAPGAASVLLPMPGSPPSSVTEPGDEPAAEHPVELGDAGRPLGRARAGRRRPGADRRRRESTAPAADRPPPVSRRCPRPAPRPSVPHSPHSGQRPEPLRRSAPHSVHRWTNTRSGHAEHPRTGV